MARPLRPLDDDNDRDKPRNKRRYADKEKRPGVPERQPERGLTRSRAKDDEDWDDDDWDGKELEDLDDDLDLDDEEEDWTDLEDEDDWEAGSDFDDDDR